MYAYMYNRLCQPSLCIHAVEEEPVDFTHNTHYIGYEYFPCFSIKIYVVATH